MSAPTAKRNGFPVSSIPRQSRDLSWSSTPSSDRSAASPNVFGFCQSSPLSIVTSATGPALVSIRRSLKLVGLATVLHVLPEHRGAHAEANAQGCETVTSICPVAEAARELRHQPDAGGRERVAARDRAAVGVQARVVRL